MHILLIIVEYKACISFIPIF